MCSNAAKTGWYEWVKVEAIEPCCRDKGDSGLLDGTWLMLHSGGPTLSKYSDTMKRRTGAFRPPARCRKFADRMLAAAVSAFQQTNVDVEDAELKNGVPLLQGTA